MHRFSSLLPPPPLHVGETLVNVENALFRPAGVARVNNETAHFGIITARPEVNQPRVEHLLDVGQQLTGLQINHITENHACKHVVKPLCVWQLLGGEANHLPVPFDNRVTTTWLVQRNLGDSGEHTIFGERVKPFLFHKVHQFVQPVLPQQVNRRGEVLISRIAEMVLVKVAVLAQQLKHHVKTAVRVAHLTQQHNGIADNACEAIVFVIIGDALAS